MAGENASARRGARTMVARPRLSSALDNALDYAVTLVCAPAGYGKTAAVNSWLSRRRIEALRFDCSALAGENNWALSQAETLPCIFVFENAHALSDGADVQKRLRRFLTAMPDGCHALVISRNVPKLGLSRLKVDGDLLEISKADLAFTELETVELFGRAGMALSIDEARDIARKTQGWPAALRLVRAEAAARGTLDEATWDAAETALYDYVSEEVLDEMGADDAGFFRGVSHLGQFCASQVAFSLEMDGGRVLEGIDRLVAAGLVQPKGFTSIGEVRYCCHPLLSDVISRRSRVSGAFGRAAVLSRASSWA